MPLFNVPRTRFLPQDTSAAATDSFRTRAISRWVRKSTELQRGWDSLESPVHVFHLLFNSALHKVLERDWHSVHTDGAHKAVFSWAPWGPRRTKSAPRKTLGFPLKGRTGTHAFQFPVTIHVCLCGCVLNHWPGLSSFLENPSFFQPHWYIKDT